MNTSRTIQLTVTGLVSILIFTGLAAYRPSDYVKVSSDSNTDGGKARKGASFNYASSRCSVLVSSKVKLDRDTDLKIAVEGGNPPPFKIVGGNSPLIDLGIRKWPKFRGDSFKGVQAKDKLAFYVIFNPEKDPVCGMWVNVAEKVSSQNYRGKSYRFCSDQCQASFFGDPAKFANQALPPEKFSITLTDNLQRKVMSVPVTISDTRPYTGSSECCTRHQ